MLAKCQAINLANIQPDEPCLNFRVRRAATPDNEILQTLPTSTDDGAVELSFDVQGCRGFLADLLSYSQDGALRGIDRFLRTTDRNLRDGTIPIA